MRVYIDIGTNRITNELLKQIKSHDFSVLIEPLPDRFLSLRDDLASDNVLVLNQAISDFDGTAKFKIANRDSCSSLRSFTSESQSEFVVKKFGTEFKMVREIDVQVSKLSTLFNQLKISHVDFLHIDAQGEDLNIVKSLGEFILRVRWVQLECVSENHQSLYTDQPSYFEVMNYMNRHHFRELRRTYHSIFPREFDILFQKEVMFL